MEPFWTRVIMMFLKVLFDWLAEQEDEQKLAKAGENAAVITRNFQAKSSAIT